MKIRITQIVWPLLAAAAVACTPADDTDAEDGAMEESAPAEVPERVSAEMMSDWDVTLDRESADESGFQMVTEGDGFSVQTGPAGIAWRATDLVEEGDFSASATFTERAAPADHREAYGVVVGGKHLADPDQEYTYFLVRGDGSYLIKRREGDDTRELVGWTTSDAVQGVESEGQENPNRLAVSVTGDQVEFSVNGTVVETLPTDEVEPWGFAGIRVNHNLDVLVDGWTVEGATGAAEGGMPAEDTAGVEDDEMEGEGGGL